MQIEQRHFPRPKVTAFSTSITTSAIVVASAVLVLLLTIAMPQAQAQTFQIIHDFTGGQDGATPNGVTIDSHGNIYGTTLGPGNCFTGGCGGVFKLAQVRSSWIFSPLYQFKGGTDGRWPHSGVTVAADGSLYGTTTSGGGGPCSLGSIPGCGTIYRLQPPAHRCQSPICPWNETVLHAFANDALWYPYANVTFDSAGDFYGTVVGGVVHPGGVYQMTRSQGGWTYSILHTFTGTPDGASPYGALTLDHAGNIYGTTSLGGSGQYYGTIFQVSPSGSGWTENVLYNFSNLNNNGISPYVGLIADQDGNYYGVTPAGGNNGGGTVFEMSPSNGGYSISVLYDGFPDLYGEGGGADSKLVMDQAGNLYGTTSVGGAYLQGTVFKLSPGSGGWTFTDLHDFDYTDGASPSGDIVLDSAGNLFGTAEGGTNGHGVVWEITP